MSDDRLEVLVSAWLVDTDIESMDPYRMVGDVMSGVVRTDQLGRTWPPGFAVRRFQPEPPGGRPVHLDGSPGHRSYRRKITPMSSLLSFALAGLVAVGGFLFLARPAEPADEVSGQVVAPSVLPTASATPAPSPTPTASAPTDAVTTPGPSKAIDWADGGIRFAADDFRIRTSGRTFRPQDLRSLSGHIDLYGAPAAELEGDWKVGDTWMRLRFEMRSDGDTWWITRIKTYDGVERDGQYLNYGGLKEVTRTPVGEAYEADLDLKATSGFRDTLVPKARLRIDGLRLEAFLPGTRPAALATTGCEPLSEEQTLGGAGGLLQGLTEMTPAQAAQHLDALNVCYEFRYQYPTRPTKNGNGAGYSERWCDPPPAGDIGPILFTEERSVLLFVVDPEIRKPRAQPAAGWGCPTY